MHSRNARCKYQGRSKINTDINKSGSVTSNQIGVHPKLEQIVRKHLLTTWEQPFHQPTVESYRQLVDTGVFSGHLPLILDSGCGTGKSTHQLAALYPQHLVIGVDRSQARLSKGGLDSGFSRHGNCVLIRAELATFWRLLLADRIFPERHFLLYPNPYPKSAHLSRRWHGHPVFPQLLGLGGEIEMRCNWEIYALEFALAVNLACGSQIEATGFQPEDGISPFERKYHERGQKLYAVKLPALLTAGFRQGFQQD